MLLALILDISREDFVINRRKWALAKFEDTDQLLLPIRVGPGNMGEPLFSLQRSQDTDQIKAVVIDGEETGTIQLDFC